MKLNFLDMIKIQDCHKNKSRYIYQQVKKIPIIAIGGISGTGKTEISYCLQQLFHEDGLKYQIVSEDNFYLTNWRDRNKIRKETDVIGMKEIGWKELITVVRIFQKLPCYDGVIIEGLYANNVKNKHVGIMIEEKGVYLEGTIRQTDVFRRLRGKETLNDFRKYVMKKEEIDVKKTKSMAHIIVPWII